MMPAQKPVVEGGGDGELREWIQTHWPWVDEELAPPTPTVLQQLTSIERMALAPEMEFLYLLCCAGFMIQRGASVPAEILAQIQACAAAVLQRATSPV